MLKDTVAAGIMLVLVILLLPLVALNADVEADPFKAPEEPKMEWEQKIDEQADSTRAKLDEILKNADMGQAGNGSLPEGDSQADPQSTAASGGLVAESFKILNEATGEVDVVSAREYVIGAVASEMPASFGREALKAQAVAAYTYALRRSANEKISPTESLKGADFSADPQKYLGYMTEEIAQKRFGDNFTLYWGIVEKAVDEVFGEVIVYENEPIAAVYHSMSSGTTEAAETVWQSPMPYLVPVESYGDTLAPNYEQKKVISADEVKALVYDNTDVTELPSKKSEWFTLGERTKSGTLIEVDIGGVTVTGAEARRIFGLRSANFTVSYANSQFTFTTIGYGHGVGLSQYGADYMARQGSDYKEILSHYYPNTEIIKPADK